jgi:transposase
MAFFFVRGTNQWGAVAKKVGPTRKKNCLLWKYIQKSLKKAIFTTIIYMSWMQTRSSDSKSWIQLSCIYREKSKSYVKGM